jgi:murein DD-endopeptidase MepM/ murein hydrolase activator NlpD
MRFFNQTLFFKSSVFVFKSFMLGIATPVAASSLSHPVSTDGFLPDLHVLESRMAHALLGHKSADGLQHEGWKTLDWPSSAHISSRALKSLPGQANTLDVIHSEARHLLTAIPNGSPLSSPEKMSSKFGERFHPILKKLKQHKGVDFGVPAGTPVHSTADGVVVVAATTGGSGYGKYVVVKHTSGFTTVYAHLQSLAVKPGTLVRKKTLLGNSGNTGRSTRAHLHYEVRYQNQALDPEQFIAWSKENYLAIFSKETTVPWSFLRQQEIAFFQLDGDVS